MPLSWRWNHLARVEDIKNRQKESGGVVGKCRVEDAGRVRQVLESPVLLSEISDRAGAGDMKVRGNVGEQPYVWAKRLPT